MRVSGRVILDMDSLYNGKVIRKLSDTERQEIAAHWKAKGAREVIFVNKETEVNEYDKIYVHVHGTCES